jgi:DNA-binding ferritin-like protein
MALYFDTLKFAERLKAAGEQNSIAHAEALKEALEQNIFNKGEIEKMFAEALQRFDKRTEEIHKRTDELAHQMAIQRAELKSELKTEIHKSSWMTIGVMSAFFTIMASFSGFIHFIH